MKDNWIGKVINQSFLFLFTVQVSSNFVHLASYQFTIDFCSLNNSSLRSNQCSWPVSRHILCHHYGNFCCRVAGVPPCETSPCIGKERGKMAVFTGYAEQNSSQMPGVCLGGDEQFWNWLVYYLSISPPLSDIGSLPFQGGKLLSPVLF